MAPLEKYNLSRFTDAQNGVYILALGEIKSGKKQSHWMWFIFPQILGLGKSEMAIKFSIKNIREAQAYLEHPVLGKRLTEISEALLNVPINDAHVIFGSPDDMKLKSSMTLFSLVSEENSVFQLVLNKFFDGEPDHKTIKILQ